MQRSEWDEGGNLRQPPDHGRASSADPDAPRPGTEADPWDADPGAYRTRSRDGSAGGAMPGGATAWALGALVLGAAAVAQYGLYRREDDGPRGARRARSGDSAPGRTARQSRFGAYAVVGRTVTINRPRSELYGYWRDFRNLPTFMENVRAVEMTGEDTARWTIAAPAGRSVEVVTRIVTDRTDEAIAWRSTPESQIDTEGKVMFRDAPGGRGTEVEAIVAYRPPGGEIGRMIAKLFQREPRVQGRRELKRFKMLMETGEIATNRNRSDADRPA